MAVHSGPAAQLARPTLSRRTNSVRSRVPVVSPAFRRSVRCEANPIDKAQSAAKSAANDAQSKAKAAANDPKAAANDFRSTAMDAASKAKSTAMDAKDKFTDMVDSTTSQQRPEVSSAERVRKMGENTPAMIPKPGKSQSTDLLTYEGLLERINGRAAMLGFLAALAGEAITGQSIASQLTLFRFSKFTFFLLAASVIVSSIVPPSKGVGDAEFQNQPFWRPGREIINGRTAMLGFVAMLATEAITGQTTLGFWLS
eukprot:jgi/Chlat1/3027/Chrsp201S03279